MAFDFSKGSVVTSIPTASTGGFDFSKGSVVTPAKPIIPQASQQDSNYTPYESGMFSPKGLQDAAPLKNLAIGAGNVAQGVMDSSPALAAFGKIFGAAMKPAISGAEGVSNWIGNSAGNVLKRILGPDRTKSVADALNNNPVSQAAIGVANDADVNQGLDAVNKVANLAGTVAGAKGIVDAVPGAIESAKATLAPKYVEAETSAWEQPTQTPKASYSKATDIFNDAASKGGKVSDTIVRNGVRLADNVQDGRYTTSETADRMRADAGKMSRETLRPALQQADNSTPPTAVSELKVPDKIIQAQGRGVTPDDMEKIQGLVDQKLSALTRKYPEGMKLSDMHDERITFSQNGKYSPVGDPSVDNNAIANRSVAQVLDSTLKSKVPSTIPYADFQKVLQGQYRAADYLDALDNKPVPKGILSRIAQTTAKVTGAAAGHAVGGGILGSVGGYHLGGMLESMVEGMSDPVRGYFLRNLQSTNPEAFSAVQNYLGAEKAAQLTRLALPSPTPLGSANNPITPVPPTTYEPQAPVNNYQSSLPMFPKSPRP